MRMLIANGISMNGYNDCKIVFKKLSTEVHFN